MKIAQTPLYIVTATYHRPMVVDWQIIYLKRLIRTLSQVDDLTWIVVQDDFACRSDVQKILKESGIDFRYFCYGPTHDFGNSQKNFAFEWIRDNGCEGVVYTADDDNSYEIPLFDEIRRTQHFSVFPVGNLGPSGIERAIIENGKFVRWDAGGLKRRFPLDWAGFAFHTKIFKDRKGLLLQGYNYFEAQNAEEAPRALSRKEHKRITWANMENESDFISKFIDSEQEIEFLCREGQDCYVWYSRPAESCKDNYTEQSKAFHQQGVNVIPAKKRFDLSHLEIANSWGIQHADALLMYAAVKHLHPKTIVEFGFAKGYSSRNFLYAMPLDCKLYSVDPSVYAHRAATDFKSKRFKFIHKKGEDFTHADIDGRKIDILFFDASHKFLSNKKIFKKVKKFLAEDCLIFVHDTGLFNSDFMGKLWDDIPDSFFVTEKGYAHRPQERMFVNYLKRRYPQFDQIHFHTENTGRMGMTMLKRYKKLSLGGRSLWLWLTCSILPQLKALKDKLIGK